MAERILIIEDNLRLRDWLVDQLKRAGYTAAGSSDGVEALGILMRSPPDAVILDLHLPRLHGIEVLRRLRAADHGKNMPVIVITGVYKGYEHAIKARKLFDIDAYIEKPFQIEKLVQSLKKAINRRQLRDNVKQAMHQQKTKQDKQQTTETSPQPPQQPEQTAQNPAETHKPVGESEPGVKQERAPHSITGNLADTPFDHLLLRIWGEHLTGILRIKTSENGGGVVERAFAFLSGKPVLGRSQADNEDFGSHLLSRGLITPEENREFQYLLARRARNAEDIFMQMGCLTPDGFTIERVRHLEELVIRCFALRDAEFNFTEAEMEIGAVAGALVPRIMHEGYRRHLSEQRLGMLFQDMGGKYLCRTAKFFDYLPILELDKEEHEFAEKIDGCHMLKDHAMGENFYKWIRLFATFLALGMIEPNEVHRTDDIKAPYPVREAAYEAHAGHAHVHTSAAGEKHAAEEHHAAEESAFEDLGDALSDELGDLAGELELDVPHEAEGAKSREEEEHTRVKEELVAMSQKIKTANYYEYFDAKPNRFKFEDIKKSYFEKRKKFSPENFIVWADGETISLAEQVFTQLTTAYNTLSNVVAKEKYDELIESSLPKVSGDTKVDRFQAQVQFESGKAFIEMEEYESAEQALREAIDLNPKEPAYHAWLGWTIYRKDKHNPANLAQAKKLIAKTLSMDQRSAVAYAFRGSMMLDEGNLDLAEIELKRALKFNPQSNIAKKELRILGERRENEKKGILGRIFS